MFTMQSLSLVERGLLAEKILSTKQQVAASVTEEFFVRHPDWLTRYGERGRKLGIEDAVYHQSYLSSAIAAGATAPFADYARWTVQMLGSRNIAAHFVTENLEQIGHSMASLLSASEQQLVNNYIRAACEACAEPAAHASLDADGEVKTGVALACGVYVQAALRGDRRDATKIAFTAMEKLADVVDLYVDLFQAAQYEVGRLWQANKITVAEEHMATAITQYVMAQVYGRLKPSERTLGRMVITGIEGELHQVGANMVADVFEARGWDVRFLGTNMPHDGVLQALQEHRPDAVGISATMLLSIPKAVHLVQAIRERFQSPCPRIILGGRAFLSTPTLAEELKAEGPATDLRSALAMM
jgi:methanogenic corrinoid protein MtbC1